MNHACDSTLAAILQFRLCDDVAGMPLLSCSVEISRYPFLWEGRYLVAYGTLRFQGTEPPRVYPNKIPASPKSAVSVLLRTR
jgi:hypothetical protein